MEVRRIEYVLKKPVFTAKSTRKKFSIQRKVNHDGWIERKIIQDDTVNKVNEAFLKNELTREEASELLSRRCKVLQVPVDGTGDNFFIENRGNTSEDITVMKRLYSGETITDFGPWPFCQRTYEFAKWWKENVRYDDARFTVHSIYYSHRLSLHRHNFRTCEYRIYRKAISKGGAKSKTAS